MKTLNNPAERKWPQLAERSAIKQARLMELVDKVFYDIRKKGDKAVLKYARQFDRFSADDFTVDHETIEAASQQVSERLKQAIALAKSNIEKFHFSQKEEIVKVETSPGVVCWREARPIEKVGIYVPGGTAPLFSTVLMLAIPAKIAGCKEIVLCSPPGKEGAIHPAILYAANLAGVTRIFAVGGIQAIGAMSFGTKSVPKVEKIFGPGNQYVMTAKHAAQYYGTAIDMPAGPSELLVVADETCRPSFVAADLLSQAEHGPDSEVILLSDNKKVVKEINKELDIQLANLPRKEMAEKALKNSRAILFKDVETCIRFSNVYAPEHLILAVENPVLRSREVTNAGSVFLGNYSCESAGDYASGTNHTLPTSGYAKAYSGVSLDSFIKKITFQQLSEEGIVGIGVAVETMAEAEELFAHKNAMTLRLGEVSAQQAKNYENS
ncbi:MAG TPA: histidinol dehydrogenase [Porphyromonadaceae bacterium]|uniref:histidinol dehydrogenase n=1 Tax=Petrimonas TaxID=307628 RepID=UPI000EED7884|nr:histidinol dehydrogenase [Petrimonas sp.]MDD4846523.1 histidinol dehydrogenase [Petrimonas sp.]HCB88500.1 histidinol dehydrogenase [Porphyromonadaceae bacterium]HOI79479.1 histidinol dehydrogenase [Petrimonas sp.]